MKQLILTAMIALLILPADAQKNKAVADTGMQWQVYRNALAFDDAEVARNALFQLIAMEPHNTALYDSLAHVYFAVGAYPQAIQAAAKAPDRRELREIRAYSLRNTGDTKSALPIFESLFAETNSVETGYQVAALQYSLKRFGECTETVTRIKSLPSAKTEKVLITTDTGESMHVSYLAAIENLEGVMFLDTGNKEKAREAFERAVAEEPGFHLAKKNLQAIQAPATK